MIKSRRASETKSLKDLGREMVLIRIFFRDFSPHLIGIQNAGCWKSGLKRILHPGDLIVGDIVGCVLVPIVHAEAVLEMGRNIDEREAEQIRLIIQTRSTEKGLEKNWRISSGSLELLQLSIALAIAGSASVNSDRRPALRH